MNKHLNYTMQDLETGEVLIRMFVNDMTKRVPDWKAEMEKYIIRHATEVGTTAYDALKLVEIAMDFTEFQREYRNRTGEILKPNADGNYAPILT